jgi:serine protease Do
MSRLLLCCLVLVSLGVASAAEPAAGKEAGGGTVEALARKVRPSVVVITVPGRDGRDRGLGTGFIVSADGLIATNRHVIGDGRPITVELANGKRYEATAVHASDRKLDLAIIRIDARGLTPLELGDSDRLADGQAVVALGNPHGLRHSVVAGVVSGRRTIEGVSMIQLAIPIEPGNSGGPLVDMEGRAHGILTLKSAVTDNLGFAVPVNALKPLLARPNPVPMSAWLTIGQLDKDDWEPLLGGRWRQRAGRISVEGTGSGFGGRALCLARRPEPDLPCEVAVTVRLDDEAGAAGLVFHADGDDHHYGFYPSGGRLRLTRFSGPDVFSWKVLAEKASPHYRPGDWNTLKVRMEKDRLRCYVNDHLVIESADDTWTTGRAGLAKFRDTRAEFKHFRMAKTLPPAGPPPEVMAQVRKTVQTLPPSAAPKGEVLGKLAPAGPAALDALREQARELEQQAARLRKLASAVHQHALLADFKRVLKSKEEDIDLLHAALLIARLDNEDVDVQGYRDEVERMARRVKSSLPGKADDRARLAALDRYLFTERGFHGSRGDYYNRSNSYLSEVLDDREGIPITLSVVYIELARRLGVRVEGVGLPGHFVVRHVPPGGEAQYIDVYDGAQRLGRKEIEEKVQALAGRPLQEEDLAPVGKRAIVVRMLRNLLNVARREKDEPGMLRYVEAILAADPDSAADRALRASLRFRAGDRPGALEDVDWLLEHPDVDAVEEVRKFRRVLTEPEK